MAKTKSDIKDRCVMVTTEHRGVFVGRTWVPSARYFAAADHFDREGMAALARKMRRKGNDALRAELAESTKRLRARVTDKGEAT